jgi:hypothetical protein
MRIGLVRVLLVLKVIQLRLLLLLLLLPLLCPKCCVCRRIRHSTASLPAYLRSLDTKVTNKLRVITSFRHQLELISKHVLVPTFFLGII